MTPTQNPEEGVSSRLNTPTNEMIAQQWALEESMTQRGFESFQRNILSAKEHKREDQTAYGAVILLHRLEAVSKGIAEFLTSMDTGKAGKRHLAAQPLRGMAPDTAAYLTLKSVLSGLTAPRTVTHVTLAVGTMIEDELRLMALREKESALYKSITQQVKKRVGYAYKRAYAIRIAQKHEDEPQWPRAKRLHVGAKLLDILIETAGIVEVTTQALARNNTIKYVQATAETLTWIDKRVNAVSMMRPHYEPMVVPPRPWTDAYSGGYLSSHIPPLPMVKVRSKAYLSELDSADMPVVYAAINAIQDTPWQINQDVLTVMNTFWEDSRDLAGLPPREGIEPPPKPHDIDTNEEARRDWRTKAAKVRQRNNSAKGSRIAVNMALGVANRYAGFERIYFPCQLDFRGRVYSVTTLSPQGSDTTKGLLRFAEGKPIGEAGGTWLAYQGCNLAGNDKVSLEDRVQWVLDNEDAIINCAVDPYTNTEWCTKLGGVAIDAPWQFLAFCFEWKGYREQGATFISSLPIAMDGSCSGIQHFSAMLRDQEGGAAVNLVPSATPSDVYRIVAEKVITQLQVDRQEGTEDLLVHNSEDKARMKEGTKSLATQWLDFGVTRKVTKRSVMTLAYGSKEFGFKQQVLEDIVKPAQDDATGADGVIDRHGFPFTEDGYAASGYMAKGIWVAVSSTLVAAVGAMKWLQDVATLVAKENLPVRWTTPVGFPVMQQYMDTRPRRVETALAGRIVKLIVQEETEAYSRTKMASGISPNFVHSCDAAHLMLTVARGTQEGISSYAMVHDSFGTTAADMEVFFQVVRDAFVEIYDGTNVLADFRDEVIQVLSPENLAKVPDLPPQGDLDVTLVRSSRYCFA